MFAFAVVERILHINDLVDGTRLMSFARHLFQTFVHNSQLLCKEVFEI